MRPIDVNQIKRAVKSGQLEFFVQKDIIYVNDCYNGNCVQLGNVKGALVNEEDEEGIVKQKPLPKSYEREEE